MIRSDINIDKTDWVSIKLGDLAAEIAQRVDNPAESVYDRFVGLEHFSSGDLKIKKWGSTENLVSSAKAFKAGDILFARRNAYLRRASLVDFDGCCSGDAFVLRENHDKIVPGFLAFVVNSNGLWDFANDNAAGTMSKRVKWRDLAEYEFLLPPKDQQSRLVELLWAMDEMIEKELQLKESAIIQYEVLKNNLVLKGKSENLIFSEKMKLERASDWKETTIGGMFESGMITQIQDGNHGEIHPKVKDYVEEGIPFIMANSLHEGQIDFDKSKKLPQSITDKLRVGFSMPGDVLLSHKGTVGEVAIVPNEIEWPYIMLTPQVTYYRIDNTKLSNKFLYYVFSSIYFQNQLKRISSQSTRAYVGITAQRTLRVVIPLNVPEMRKVVEILSKVDENLKVIKTTISRSKSLQKSLINQVF
ncbi:MAG: hypothetical protein HON27_02720 [Candidatus Marinimicrobia bacterium]|jgi:type I restriction enzyme, S subunit|nr:hypothetical protein [Candidatus Neomarinimicrobiota bacterium]MBT5269983.1 hypothetical protein [Candidatus Neomarinimicrobiota bacterium]